MKGLLVRNKWNIKYILLAISAKIKEKIDLRFFTGLPGAGKLQIKEHLKSLTNQPLFDVV